MLTSSVWSYMAGASAVTAALLAALGAAAGGWLAAEDHSGQLAGGAGRGHGLQAVFAAAGNGEQNFGFAAPDGPPPPPDRKGGPPPFRPDRKSREDNREGPPNPPDRKGGPNHKHGPDHKRGPITHVVRLERMPDAETLEKARKALGERGSLTPDEELKLIILRGEHEVVHTAARILRGHGPAERAIELVRLREVEPDKVAKLVTAVLPKGLEIMARPAAKAIIFEGPRELVEQAEHLARQLDGGPHERDAHRGPPPHKMMFKDDRLRDVLLRRLMPLGEDRRLRGGQPDRTDPPGPRGRPHMRVEGGPARIEIEIDDIVENLPPGWREKLRRLLPQKD